MRAIVLMSVAACGLWGQALQFSGPSTGLVYDQPSRTIRPILGVPGSAYLGSPVLSGLPFTSLSPDGTLGITLGGPAPALLSGLLSSLPVETPLDQAISAPDRVFWSADSTTAVLYSSAERLLQRLRIQSGNVVAETPAPLEVVPAGIAVTADHIYLAHKDGRRILAFPGLTPVLDERDGLAEPVALALSADGRSLYVVERADGYKLRTYDLADRRLVSEISLEFTPADLTPLAPKGVFLLAARTSAGDPLWIVDLRSSPAVYFVPSGEEGN